VLLAFVAAGPALYGSFIWDDLTFVRDNPLVNGSDGWSLIWFTFTAEDYWPLSYSLFSLERRCFGEATFGYHVVAVALHAAAGVGAWRCLKLLSDFGLFSAAAAWVAAAWFVVHPVNMEVAAWIFQSKTSLSALLFFAAIYTFMRAVSVEGRWHERYFALTLGLFALAMLAKSGAVMLPIILTGGLFLAPKGRYVVRRAMALVAGLLLLAGLLGGLSLWVRQLHAIGRVVVRSDDVAGRLWVATKAPWFYIGKAILPLNLSVIYPRWNHLPGNLEIWLPGVAIMLVAGCIVVSWRWRWSRLAAGCLGYTLLMLLPCLGVVNISFMRYSFVADHWQYLAIIGPIVLVVAGLEGLFALRWHTLPTRSLATAATLLLLVGMTTLSRRRAATFTSEEAMWRATLATNPSAFLAHNNLGIIEQESGRLELALQHYQSALAHGQQQGADVEVLGGIAYNYAQVLASLGRLVEALAQDQAALAWLPKSAQAHWLAADLLRGRGDADAAILEYRAAQSLAPQIAAIQASLGEALRAAGQVDLALVELEAAVRLLPAAAGVRQSLGLAYLTLGRPLDAAEQFKMAVSLAPEVFSHRMNLGFAYASLGAWEQATDVYQTAVATMPSQLDGQVALIKVLTRRGLKARALRELQRIKHWEEHEELRELERTLRPSGP